MGIPVAAAYTCERWFLARGNRGAVGGGMIWLMRRAVVVVGAQCMEMVQI